jgi:hypothetical protein
MNLNEEGLRAASTVFSKLLAAEAEAQRAYAHSFPDGRMSLELEWVDLELIAEAVITAYISEASK